MNEKEFKPYIPAEQVLPEFTATSVLLGILLAVVFGGANAYLGLRVGMTVSASIPAAVISMGLIRVILKRDSILENNMVQTIGSAGESVAAGAIFTLPALFLWAREWGSGEPSLVEITVIAMVGGALGVLFMVPLRKALIVKEHGVLPYPEGTACAKVLMAGEEGGKKAVTVFQGMGVAAVYKFLADGLGLFPSQIHYESSGYAGAAVGVDVLPALLGVGYICGLKISSYLFAGGVLGWLVLIPLLVLFGGDTVLFPASVSIKEVFKTSGAFGIHQNFIKYIGAGAVAAGGVISLLKSLPLIGRTFRDALRDYGWKGVEKESRTEKDIALPVILILVLALAVLMWLLPFIPVNFYSALLIVLFGFFFATVSSRMVGMIGSSNNPVSGMTIATLLIASFVLKSFGQTGHLGMVSAIAIGSVICIIAAIAGDTSQDLKTGYLLGATPKRQQMGELIGVTAASLAIGAVLYLLDRAWGFGSAELSAPQATLMKMIVEGVMGGNLPWNLIFAGVGIGIMAEILRIPVLPFAIGLYLPIHLSTPMMTGGLVRWWAEQKKSQNLERKKKRVESGTLYCAGLIAGEGVVGILLAVLALIPFGKYSFGAWLLRLGDNRIFDHNIGGLLFFILLILSLWKVACREKEEQV